MITIFNIVNKTNGYLKNYIPYTTTYNNKDLMNYIDEDDKLILNNKRLLKMSPVDWGMSVGISNEYIQSNLLKTIYPEVYTEIDDIRKKGFNSAVNIAGYDFIFRNNNKFYKVQSKLRQVKGVDAYSCQVNITTSRRRNNQKEVSYEKDDFDYLFISLVNIKDNYNNRNDINKWGFSFIPVNELIDENNTKFLVKNVSSEILNKYKLNFI
tara:strand:+ start:176 stop:805 length:630 start_codon:yes stop_codon:yes gene_type:complete